MSVRKKVTLVNGIDKRFTAANKHSDKESAYNTEASRDLIAEFDVGLFHVRQI